MKYKIIINPVSDDGKGEKYIEPIKTLFNKKKLDFSISLTKKKNDAFKIAKNAVSENFDVITAAGGDGTVHEVVNGIVGSSALFGVIPIGFGNDFARSIHTSWDLENAVNTVTNGKIVKIDVGRINEHFFINSVGFGFDGFVVNEADKTKNKQNSFIRYLRGIYKGLTKYKCINLKLEINGDIRNHSIMQIVISNTKYQGRGFKFSPNAKFNDGLFDVCLINPMSLAKKVISIPLVYFGKHISNKTLFTYIKAPSIHGISDDFIYGHMDGEKIMLKEFNVSIIPSCLNLLT